MKKKMKKSLCLLGAIMIGAAVIFSGCGSSGAGGGSAATEKASPESEVTAVIDGFFTTMQSGDLSKLTEYCTDEVLANQELDGFADAEAFNQEFYDSLDLESMGLTQDDISEEAKTAISNMANTVITNLIESYAISDVSVNGDTAKVIGTVTYGYNTDFDIDIDAINDEYTSSMAEEQITELAEIYTNEGEAAMMKKLINDMVPGLMDKYSEALLATEGATDNLEATVTKTDGKWMITEMNITSAQTTEEAGESE